MRPLALDHPFNRRHGAWRPAPKAYSIRKGPSPPPSGSLCSTRLGIMLAIVIPTILATLGTAYWFRASNTRARYMPDFAYSGRLELLVWSIPIMTVILVGGVAWVGSYDLDPPKPIASAEKPVRVQVVALDWKWLFIYPDQGIAAVNQLTIPVGTPISFELTSSGVMNSFFVPQLGGQIYTMAGMVTRLYLQGRPYRDLSRNVGKLQRRRIFRHGTSTSMRFQPRNLRSGWLQRAPTARYSMRKAMPRWRSRARRSRLSPIVPWLPDLFNGILSAVSTQCSPAIHRALTYLASQRAEK